MSTTKEAKQRKAKVSKAQTYSARRQADRANGRGAGPALNGESASAVSSSFA